MTKSGVAVLGLVLCACGGDPLEGCPQAKEDEGAFVAVTRDIVKTGKYLTGAPITPHDRTMFRCELGCTPETKRVEPDLLDQTCQ